MLPYLLLIRRFQCPVVTEEVISRELRVAKYDYDVTNKGARLGRGAVVAGAGAEVGEGILTLLTSAENVFS